MGTGGGGGGGAIDGGGGGGAVEGGSAMPSPKFPPIGAVAKEKSTRSSGDVWKPMLLGVGSATGAKMYVGVAGISLGAGKLVIASETLDGGGAEGTTPANKPAARSCLRDRSDSTSSRCHEGMMLSFVLLSIPMKSFCCLFEMISC